MLGVGGDRLGGAGNSVVGDVSAADVVHGGGVRPVGVDAHVRVVRALVGAGHGHGCGAVVGVGEPGGCTQDQLRIGSEYSDTGEKPPQWTQMGANMIWALTRPWKPERR